ncbi:MAG: hypothetical protein V4657_12440 [Pseudomonadota bacterium]
MTLPASSETLGTGGVIATSTVGGKEYQVMMHARADGHIVGSRPDYIVNFPAAANSATREVAEIFNASATLVIRVRGIWIIPTQTAIVGAQTAWDINKISAVGTTGLVAVTPRPMDSSNVVTLTGVTCGHSSTAGGTLNHLWFPVFLFNEETAAPNGLIAYQNQLPTYGDTIAEIVLRQNEGLQIKSTVGAVGLTGCLMQFTVDN